MYLLVAHLYAKIAADLLGRQRKHQWLYALRIYIGYRTGRLRARIGEQQRCGTVARCFHGFVRIEAALEAV